VVFGPVNRDLWMAAERLARPGETVGAAELTQRWGGKGGNQAVAAARLGAQVHLVSAVGDDETGAEAVRALAADGVDCRYVRRAPGVPTGTAVVLVDREGRNSITVAAGWHAIVNPAPALASLDGRFPPGVVFTPNQHELHALTGLDDPGQAARRLAAGTSGRVAVHPAGRRTRGHAGDRRIPRASRGRGDAARLTRIPGISRYGEVRCH
jgi:sugar/nucleoside kinase (ribokinase family)